MTLSELFDVPVSAEEVEALNACAADFNFPSDFRDTFVRFLAKTEWYSPEEYGISLYFQGIDGSIQEYTEGHCVYLDDNIPQPVSYDVPESTFLHTICNEIVDLGLDLSVELRTGVGDECSGSSMEVSPLVQKWLLTND